MRLADGQWRGGEFSVAASEPEHLMPANATTTADGQILSAVFTGLVEYDTQTAEPRNAMAESITSADQQTWTIKLKPGWTFHNGEPVTAGSYVDRYAPGHSVIYVIQAHGGNARPVAVAAAGVIRDAIPPDQIPRTGVYLGQVSRLLKGKPTLTLEDVRFNRVSLKFWQGVKPLVRGSVVVVLRSFNPPGLTGGHTAGFPIGPGVRIARGPHPTSAVPATRLLGNVSNSPDFLDCSSHRRQYARTISRPSVGGTGPPPWLPGDGRPGSRRTAETSSMALLPP